MKNFKILLVEDEPGSSIVITRMLERLGHYVVASVSTGETALQVAPHLLPDLILADVHLAGDINGISLANAVNSRLGIPSIIMSSSVIEYLRELDDSVSQYEFLGKPFSSNQLAEAISRAHAHEEQGETSGRAFQIAEPLER
jgi:two-component system, response regulator PdtaR